MGETELKRVLKHIPARTATGLDDFPASLRKLLGPRQCQALRGMFDTMLVTGQVLEEWSRMIFIRTLQQLEKLQAHHDHSGTLRPDPSEKTAGMGGARAPERLSQMAGGLCPANHCTQRWPACKGGNWGLHFWTWHTIGLTTRYCGRSYETREVVGVPRRLCTRGGRGVAGAPSQYLSSGPFVRVALSPLCFSCCSRVILRQSWRGAR